MGFIIPNMGPRPSATFSHTTLADALFSKTQQRVFGVLFGRPERSFFANEIVRLSGVGVGAVHRELATLESAGLVRVSRMGNQKHFQANPNAPIFAELRGIVLKTVGLADVLREALAPLAPRIAAAFVYGSLAKGTDTAHSDVDLMVVGDRIDYADIFRVASDAEQILGRKVNPTVLTQRELQKQSKDDGFHSRVLAQPKIFVIGSAHELGEPRQARPSRTTQG
jgi:predicted nucleotidyltransferase